MQRTSGNPTRHSAFTLIELLVVIAIISLLAAILFPVFNKARDRARQSTCTSNLKQIYTGLRLYTQDFDGKYPEKANLGNAIFRAMDDIYSLPYLTQAYIKERNLWFCPSGYLPHRQAANQLPGYYWSINDSMLKRPDGYEDGTDDPPQQLLIENYFYSAAPELNKVGTTGQATWPSGKRYCPHVSMTRYNYLGMDGRVKLWPADKTAKLGCGTGQ